MDSIMKLLAVFRAAVHTFTGQHSATAGLAWMCWVHVKHRARHNVVTMQAYTVVSATYYALQ